MVTSLDARILLTGGHFVATCLTATARGMDGGVGFVLFASFALACCSILGGWELFVAKTNSVHAIAHLLGGLLQSRIVLYELPTAPHLWYVVLLAHAPATAVTIGSFARLYLFPHGSKT